MSPLRLPRSDPGRSTYAIGCVAASTVGSKISIRPCPVWSDLDMRCRRRHDRDRPLLGAESALDVERRPRALGLVLVDHVRELARVAEGSAIEEPRQRAAYVAHHQAQRAAHGEARAPSRAEEVVAGVD